MDNLLPPIALLRTRDWGRDVTLYARGEIGRIEDLELVDMLTPEDEDGYIKSIVDLHRYRRALGDLWSYRRRGGVTEEAAAIISRGRHYESELAEALGLFVERGSRVISVSQRLAVGMAADPANDVRLCDLPNRDLGFYVHLEGDAGEAPEGGALDGFLIDLSEDDDGYPHLHATPLSRTPPAAGEIGPMKPTFCMRAESGEETLSAILSSLVGRLGERIERIGEVRARWKDEEVDPEDTDVTTKGRRAMKLAAAAQYDADRDATAMQTMMLEQEHVRWARLIGGAIRCVIGEGPYGVAGFQAEAPADIVTRALAGGTGARKAEQKLVAAGFPKWMRYDLGQTAPDPAAPRPEPTPAPVAAGQKTTDTRPARVKPEDKRKAKSRRRQSDTMHTGTAPAADETLRQAPEQPPEPAPAPPRDMPADTGRDVRAESGKWQDDEVVDVTRHDPAVLDLVDAKLKRCFKDLPALDSRNWEAAFPPALASMIMRRARVPQLPRETNDATRRRLAADILPRLRGLPELISRLRNEEAANPELRRAHALTSPSVNRDVDPEVADVAAHPIYVLVRDDDAISRAIRFPGVETDGVLDQERTTFVRAWREAQTLHLMGVVHEGCLQGFRRIELDLDDMSVISHDAEADEMDPQDLLDILYAPVADAVLGPVDPAEAWRYERRPSRQAKPSRQQRNSVVQAAEPEADDAAGLIAKPGDWTPHPIDFESWEGVSRETPPLTEGMRQRISDLLAQNAVSRAVLRALDSGDLDGDDDAARVRRAMTRHLASIAAASGRLDAISTPDLPDEVDLRSADDADGVIVVSDRALFEHASPGILGGRPSLRERPLCILYRLRRNGLSAMTVQATADDVINLAQWSVMPLSSDDADDDLTWYIRGAVAGVLGAAPAKTVVPAAPSVPLLAALPGHSTRSDGTGARREGPRRVVAQARICPEDLSVAAAVAQGWFAEQAQRHGDRLIEDRRDAGEWMLEHESEDRGVRSRWSVTLRLADAKTGALDIVVRTTLATGVKPRLPTLVREIAAATPTRGPDGVLHINPPNVRTRSELSELLRHLQSPDRVLPTLLMSQDARGQYMRPPEEVARQALGAMNVRTVSDQMTYELSEVLGQEYRTFGGAARLFQPRFDPDADAALRHPRVMNDSGADRAIADLISRATAATVTRYDIEDSPSNPAAAVQAPAPTLAPAVDRAADDARIKAEAERIAADRLEAERRERARAAEAEARREREREEERRSAEPSLPFTEPEEDVRRNPGLAWQAKISAYQAPATDQGQQKGEDTGPASPADTVAAPEPRPHPESVSTSPGSDDAAAEDAETQAHHEPVETPEEPPRHAAPVVDIEEIVRRVAGIMAAEGPRNAPVAGVTEEETSHARPQASVDADDIERRVEVAVARRFSTLGLGELLGSVSTLVGRMDAMLAARDIIGPVQPSVSDPHAVAVRDAEIARLKEELRAERETTTALLTEADDERASAVAETAALRRALNDQRRMERGIGEKPEWPEDLSGLADWLERNVLPNVVVTAKAYREMRRVKYTDMERLCRTLQLFDGAYIDMREGVTGGRERWEEGLRNLRLDAKVQTKQGISARPGDYSFTHQGRTYTMDRHLRGIESIHNDHDRLLRIYYTYDKEEGRVLIGHMPTHLTTIDS